MVCVDEEGWLRVDEPQLMELAARGGGGKEGSCGRQGREMNREMNAGGGRSLGKGE